MNGIKTLRNIFIVAGFYGIYFAVFQFLALIWRRIFVFDRTFSNFLGHIQMWSLTEFPFWVFCILSGYCIPYLIESDYKIRWALALGSMFLIHALLFTYVHYAEGPDLFDYSTRLLSISLPLVLCPLGVILHNKRRKEKTEQPFPPDRE